MKKILMLLFCTFLSLDVFAGSTALDTSTSQVSNTTDGLATEFYSYSMPANTVSADGKLLYIHMQGTVGNYGMYSRLVLKFGNTVVYDSDNDGSMNNYSNPSFIADFKCFRTSSTAAKCSAWISTGFTSASSISTDFSSSMDIKIFGYGSNTDDTVKEIVQTSLLD